MKKKTASRRRTTKVQKSEEKSYEITGVILFLFGLFILFSLFSDSTGFSEILRIKAAISSSDSARLSAPF